MPFSEKLKLLWAAFCFLFSKKAKLTVYKDAFMDYGPAGLSASLSVKNLDKGAHGRIGKYEQWSVSFDGTCAVGYIDGKRVSPPPIDNSDLNQALKLATKAAEGTLSEDPILSSLQVAESFYVNGHMVDLVEILEHAVDFAKSQLPKTAPIDIIVEHGGMRYAVDTNNEVRELRPPPMGVNTRRFVEKLSNGNNES